MQAPRVVRRESSPESNTLVRNESLEIDPTDDSMSGVQIAESDAVPSVAPAAHQTLCTEGTENDIGLVPTPMTVLESGVQQYEIPVVPCAAYDIASQHSSGKSCQ